MRKQHENTCKSHITLNMLTSWWLITASKILQLLEVKKLILTKYYYISLWLFWRKILFKFHSI